MQKHDNHGVGWPLRSLLYVPATKPDWLQKAEKFHPGGIILDLEDAVAASSKVAACESAREGIGILGRLGIKAFVRINSLEEGGDQDLGAVVMPGLAGIVLPKTRSAEDVRALDLALSHAEGRTNLAFGSIAVLPTAETIEGMMDMRAIAGASKRVNGLVGLVGGAISGDFSRAAGFRPTDDGFEQLYLASKTVMESRAAGANHSMATIIGTDLKDLDAVRALMVKAKAIGFVGAVVIYPPHAAIANEVFAPSTVEIENARGIIEALKAANAAGDGAVAYKGRMIDKAMLAEAQAIVEEAERLQARQHQEAKS
jgi:citrate lyase subunit beta/citryl-CoA lyase